MSQRHKVGRKRKATAQRKSMKPDGNPLPNDLDSVSKGPLTKPEAFVNPKDELHKRASAVWDIHAPKSLLALEDAVVLETYCCLEAERQMDPAAMNTGRMAVLRSWMTEALIGPLNRPKGALAPSEVEKKGASNWGSFE